MDRITSRTDMLTHVYYTTIVTTCSRVWKWTRRYNGRTFIPIHYHNTRRSNEIILNIIHTLTCFWPKLLQQIHSYQDVHY